MPAPNAGDGVFDVDTFDTFEHGRVAVNCDAKALEAKYRERRANEEILAAANRHVVPYHGNPTPT